MDSRKPVTAALVSKQPPTKQQEQRFLDFLTKKYGEGVRLCWKQDETAGTGFRLEVGGEVYDWSPAGRLEQFRRALEQVRPGADIVPLIRQAAGEWSPDVLPEEQGIVETVGDGIAQISGLEHAVYGEVLVFSSGIRGLVQTLNEDRVGCILLGDDGQVSSGTVVRRTGKPAGIPVGEAMLGRVVNALGVPIDGLGDIPAETFCPVERPAPAILDRQPVDRPMETGILTIDAMFPIGRGQRELIIGDRQTGKTAIALDTIVNQKGKDVVCIYVAIGQKASSVAKLVENLRKREALDYTVVVSANASEPAPFSYLAPYAGCAVGEFFMEQGRDVLIVYDDLSKHAVAYRTISLLLERAPGREAYPGDIFFLHSRLLERSAHLSEDRGGGSMTALPIAETLSGDVSAYIPTNIISITDGQIFLESDLFFAGQRPAVNVGLSVSRVGSAAQYPALKKASGALRLSLAQYREKEVFTQFSSDLDEETRSELKFGAGLMKILRQKQYSAYQLHEQVILLVTALGRVFQSIEVEQVERAARELLEYFHIHCTALCRRIDSSRNFDDADREEILSAGRAFMQQFGR